MKVDNLFDFWSLSCMKKDGFAERLHMAAAVQYNCFFSHSTLPIDLVCNQLLGVWSYQFKIHTKNVSVNDPHFE